MKVGIIGCGKISQIRHIPEYLANPDVEIAGYYDMNTARAQDIAQRFGGKAYSSAEELIADPEIDAVSVCVANDAHAKMTVLALSSGKHVLCEKPMATTLEDCQAMVDAADQYGKWLMIDQYQRFTPAHRKAKQLIEEGAIGKPITFRTVFGHSGPDNWSVDKGTGSWFFDKTRAAMGAVGDLGIHKTDLIQYLLDTCVAEVKAVITTLDKKDTSGNLVSVDDNAFCIYTMENGIIGTMTASWTYYGEEDNSTMIYGTEGIMKIYSNPDFAIEVIDKDGTRILYELPQIMTNDAQEKSGIIDAFVESVITGKEPPITGRSVLSAMKAVFAGMESSRTGKSCRTDELL